MDQGESIQNMETTDNFLIQMLTDEEEGPEFAQAYLKASFLSSAIDALFDARHQANLTQKQVAELMKTKQTAIARIEADTSGTLSLHRYVEFALACGMVPLDMKLVPVESLQKYILAHPEAPRTQELYNTWLLTSGQTVPASGNTTKVDVTTVASSSEQSRTYYDPKGVVEYVENFLRQSSQYGNESKPLNTTLRNQSYLQTSSGHTRSQEGVAA